MAVSKQSPEEKILQSLIDSYSGLNNVQPSSWITFDNEFNLVLERLVQVCHADMQLSFVGSDTLVTAVPVYDKLSLQYLHWLVRGPFRSFQDKISIEEYDGHPFIRCSDLGNWPANVLYNFCIATRIPIEHPYDTIDGNDMIEHGVDENVAYTIHYYFNGVDQPILSAPRCNNSHYWFDPASSLSNLINGFFSSDKVSKKSYKESPLECRPTNCIWGLSDLKERKMIKGLTPLEISELFQKEMVIG